MKRPRDILSEKAPAQVEPRWIIKSVWFTPEQSAWLDAVSSRTGKSVMEIIRAAIDEMRAIDEEANQTTGA